MPHSEVPTSSWKPRLPKLLNLAAAAACLLVLAYSAHQWLANSKTFDFDDAFMFYRYAEHIRQGHGITWNIGSPAAYGATSLPWLAVIFLGAFLPFSMVQVLTCASWLSGMLGLAVLAWSVSTRAQTRFFSSFLLLFPVFAFLFVHNGYFAYNMTNGMETMLALLLNAVFCHFALRFFAAPTRRHAVHLASIGTLAILTRPEALLCIALVPALGFLLLFKRAHLRETALFYGVLAAFLALDLLVCRLYFHSALPLSFYLKARHAYTGYARFWDWPSYLAIFLKWLRPVLIPLLLVVRARRLPTLLTFAIPVAATVLYLTTVTQIMGYPARYYLPYLPFLLIPALLALDDAFSATSIRVRPAFFARLAALLLLFSYVPVHPLLSRHLQSRVRVYPRPVFHVAARTPLPWIPDWFQCLRDFIGTVAAPLPAGSTVAASEVGMLGALAPQSNIIDLVGLNDTTIALHGFSMAYLASTAPDVIWLPHTDYTYLYGRLASDPALLRDYTVIAGAFDFGIAVRRNGPHYRAIMARLGRSWGTLYPGTRLDDYIATSITWDSTGREYRAPNTPVLIQTSVPGKPHPANTN